MYSDEIKRIVAKEQSARAKIKASFAPIETAEHWKDVAQILAEIAQDYERKAAEKC